MRHQIEAFDHFVMHLLPHIVSETPDLRVHHSEHEEEHIVSICNVSVLLPRVRDPDGVEREFMPHMARTRGVSYMFDVTVDVVHDIYIKRKHEERRVYREVLLASIPAMLGSCCCHLRRKPSTNECRIDHGGYFIISGIEKALISQERLRTNTAFVFAMRGGSKYKLCCEIRSCHETKLRSTSTLYLYVTAAKRGAIPDIVAMLPFIQNVTVPLLALFRLLGVRSCDEAVMLVAGDARDDEVRMLRAILDRDQTAHMDKDSLCEWIGKEGTIEVTRERRQRYVDHIISHELLPHMGLSNDADVLRAKAAYLGVMVRKLMRVHAGEIEPDDRDNYAAKRVDPSGLGLLFRQLYRSVHKAASAQMHRLAEQNKMRFFNVATLICTKRITTAIRTPLAACLRVADGCRADDIPNVCGRHALQHAAHQYADEP